MRVDEAVINFALYENANEFLGHAEITLPNIQSITQELRGAGISGNIDAVIMGHVQAMSLGINFRTPTEAALNLMSPGLHKLDARGALQETDLETGEKKVVAVKYLMTVESKGFNNGQLSPASPSNTSGDYALRSITMYRDGKKKYEVNPSGFIYEVDGVDYLADVRTALGK